jgi:DNA-binding transcriptional MerR regulator
MQVKQLADAFGVNKNTVRYYTRINLLRPSRSSENGYRFYPLEQQNRLRFILSARDLGFSIEDIKQIFSESDKGKTPCPTVRVLIEKRLAETEQRFIEMAKLRDKMRNAVDTWDQKPDKEPCNNVICHLIEDVELSNIDNEQAENDFLMGKRYE